MVQDITTYLLVFAATVYTFRGLYRLVFPVRHKPSSPCGTCKGCHSIR